MEQKKLKLFETIKNSFEKLGSEEIDFLKLKDQEHEVSHFNYPVIFSLVGYKNY